LNRERGAIPSLPYAGFARALGIWPLDLTRQKHAVSHEKVAQLLRDLNYSLAKQPEDGGSAHPFQPRRGTFSPSHRRALRLLFHRAR
jgi:hypothetical protein